MTHAKTFKRGDLIWMELKPTGTNVQEGRRPGVVVQNAKGNFFSPNLIVIPLTRTIKRAYPTQVLIDNEPNLDVSTAMADQIMTISKSQVVGRKGAVSAETMRKIDAALAVSIGLSLAA